MSIVPKITRLTKLPALLKHKQEKEERTTNDPRDFQRRQNQQQSNDRDQQNREHERDIRDHPFLQALKNGGHKPNPAALNEFRIHSSSPREPKPAQAKKPDGVGENIDLKA